MATSEIEKLERRYAENPHGLTFAPLAEVHRKNGDLARSLELLTAGLELHPNYIPASIVLGRCHQDLGDLPSAEAAFAHVLRLDDENVIALKSLADINEKLERLGEAETWLRRLVSIDRSNDEAKEQLRKIEAARQGEKETEPEAPTPSAGLEMIDLTPETVPESAEPASVAELLPVDIAAMDMHRPEAESTPSPEVAARDEEPAEIVPTAVAGQPEEDLADVPEPGGELAVAAPTDEPAEATSPLKAVEAANERGAVEPLPGLISAEFQPPLEATGGLGVETSDEVFLEVSGNSEYRVPDASEDLRSLAARLNPPASPPPTERQPEPASLEEPESKRGSELEFLVTQAESERDTAPEPAKATSYVATETQGQSVASFFRALVAARPPSGPASGSAPTPHAADGARDGRAKDAAVSFDDFFNSEADGTRGSGAGEDDLDQFQSWLQNLKR